VIVRAHIYGPGSADIDDARPCRTRSGHGTVARVSVGPAEATWCRAPAGRPAELVLRLLPATGTPRLFAAVGAGSWSCPSNRREQWNRLHPRRSLAWHPRGRLECLTLGL